MSIEATRKRRAHSVRSDMSIELTNVGRASLRRSDLSVSGRAPSTTCALIPQAKAQVTPIESGPSNAMASIDRRLLRSRNNHVVVACS